ncbi:hypothetical protein HR45_08495 [Shewanella mangrovi]|uniref:DUF4325 domain-containing protein n=1 Tax=Shewanella mangrovi TaxID=1515746 RepID=A0A094JIL9_9GAMM|nr:STAS-like domain-containing protein [Shewanella mangrovi]KFZ37874.1 hypothetical protein HR45_08495 [Shewanella mangrovi]
MNSVNNVINISVVKDFHNKPKGRYADDAPGCEKTAGEVFRKNILLDAINNYEKVIVDLSGYNRYGRSFLDEAFAGLISREGLTKDVLDSKLEVKHDSVPKFLEIINERIEAAENKRLNHE